MKKYIQLTVVVFSFLIIVLVKRAIWKSYSHVSSMDSQDNSSSALKAEENIISADETLPTDSPTAPKASISEITPLTTDEPSSNNPFTKTTNPLPTKKSDRYKDGTFTGSIEDAIFGEIQVKVVVAEGKISNIIFLKYPNGDPDSRSINIDAMPRLKSEAIESQSAQVDGVTGASFTSQSFRDSLQNALTKASS